MAESQNSNRIVCSLCSDTLGQVSFVFVNCGHVICDQCNRGLEEAKRNPSTEPDDWDGTGLDFYGTSINCLTLSLCILCRREGRIQRLFLTEEVDEEKRVLEERVKELERTLFMEGLATRMNDLELRCRHNERALGQDGRPEDEITVLVEVEEETNSSFYCVRCGNQGHLAKDKVCLTASEGKAAKMVVLGNQEKFVQWKRGQFERSRRRFEERWNQGSFVPRWFYERFYAGENVESGVSADWVKKI